MEVRVQTRVIAETITNNHDRLDEALRSVC